MDLGIRGHDQTVQIMMEVMCVCVCVRGVSNCYYSSNGKKVKVISVKLHVEFVECYCVSKWKLQVD